MSEKSTQELIEKYNQLVKKRESLKEKLVQLQTTHNHYKTELEKNASCLKQEFNVSSLNEAVALENKMKAEISEKLEKLEKAVSECDIEADQIPF